MVCSMLIIKVNHGNTFCGIHPLHKHSVHMGVITNLVVTSWMVGMVGIGLKYNAKPPMYIFS